MAQTLYDKIWQAHVIEQVGEDSLIYIDRHLIHEVTSPQAFAGLNEKGRKVRRPDKTVSNNKGLATELASTVVHTSGGEWIVVTDEIV